MPDQPPRKRRRWLFILLMILISVPVLLILVFQIAFLSNGIRTDQQKPPADLITVKPNAAGTTLFKSGKAPTSYEDVLIANANEDIAALYKKCHARLPSYTVGLPFDQRMAGQPLSPEQKQWLLANRELIKDILRLARFSHGPIYTCEQLQGLKLTLQQRAQMPVPDYLFYQRCARILAAETRRLRDAGDLTGAAEVLTATYPLAQSIREPFLISHLVAIASQSIASYELSQWLIDGSITPEIAARLRATLSAEAITPQDFRRPMELEYQNAREIFKNLIEGPFSNSLGKMVNATLLHNYPGELSERTLASELIRDPFNTTGGLAYAVGRTISIKASASEQLARFDDYNRDVFRSIQTNQPVNDSKLPDPISLIEFPNFEEARTRTATSLTNININLTALDLVSNTPPTATDPFTNAPLKTVQSEDSTLIYSLGPDRADQHGTVSYDPTNGTLSAGDIFLRIPKHR